jgi:Ca2+-binding EF-hand superfamily protein
LFKTIDSDGSGSLSLTELILHLKSITDDISEENIERIFEGIDASGDKVVDFEEFKVIKTKLVHD